MRHALAIVLALAACSTTPRLESPMLSERSQAVKATDDQATLARVARTDEAWTIRTEAVKRLTDQDVLAEVARKDKHHRVRLAAVDRLTSDRVLAGIARKDREREVRLAAAQRIKDTAVLRELKDAGRSVRVLVLGRLGEEDELVAFTRNDAYHRIDGGAAAGLIKTEERLLRVLASGDGLPQQVAHVGLLVHSPEFQRRFPGALVRVDGRATGKNYEYFGAPVRISGDSGTIAVVHDGTPLIATHWRTPYPGRLSVSVWEMGGATRFVPVDVGPLVRRLAEKLPASDLRRLRDSPSYQVRVAVISIIDPAAIVGLAEDDPQERVRVAAVRTMTDREALTRISKDAGQVTAVRKAATRRLTSIPK